MMSQDEQSTETQVAAAIEETEKSSITIDPNLTNENTDEKTQQTSQECLAKAINDTDHKSTPVKKSEPDFYHIKWIDFNHDSIPILLQNANGPCPLLAIFNILLLSKKIVLNSNMDAITTQRVLALLAEFILERDVSNLSDEERANYEQNVQDTLAVLHKLQTGLDVNLKFDGVDQFEYTRECIIFDLCNISLYHGWVVDPQDKELRKILGKNSSSYNQLVEKMISQRQSESEELLRESLLIEQFLDENPSQLTHFGILQLNQTMRDSQMAVFFRNNHFSTIWKKQDRLLVLVSDQGYLDHRSIVFETLTDVDNDTQFTDGYGRIWRKPETANESKDRELAMAMQHEEERQYHQEQLQQQQQTRETSNTTNTKKNKNRSKKSPDDREDKGCVIS